jgi:hypothetical protein
MRKKLTSTTCGTDVVLGGDWLALEQAARVEVSSEAEGYPVEGALLKDVKGGWRASEPGNQTIRLSFDHPQIIRAVRLVFREEECERTQEFLLRWLRNGAASWRDIVRQQWNFSPPNTVTECEEYNVELVSAVGLELSVDPDISRRKCAASLERLQLSVRS